MASTVLITGASTGIGHLTARALAVAGYRVYASMRDVHGKNAAHAKALEDFGSDGGLDLRPLELDVQSQPSAIAAVEHILGDGGQLDAVVHNAGHLVVGYAEAFTAVEIAKLFDINVLGNQRVNRAALPHMRDKRSGVLVYVGSTIMVSTPPFLAPYVASKAASDSMALASSYELNHFGIETCIVMPGAFTSGTQHFPNATGASDQKVTGAYVELDSLLAKRSSDGQPF